MFMKKRDKLQNIDSLLHGIATEIAIGLVCIKGI